MPSLLIISFKSVAVAIVSIMLVSFTLLEFEYTIAAEMYDGGSRPYYIYDRANILSDEYRILIDKYLRQLDDSTSAEIVIYTIPSFVGHGIKNDGQEIQDRDTLAHYIFNEVTLDGIKGIGKKGKDNGVLLLYSTESQVGGGSMRIEVGRGLEGSITDGTAGEILDSYLVPARENYEATGNTTTLNTAFLNTAIALGQHIGYHNTDPVYNLPQTNSKNISYDDILGFIPGLIVVLIIPIAIVIMILVIRHDRSKGKRSGGHRRGYGGDPSGSAGAGWAAATYSGGGYSGGGYSGGGYSGGGGTSGGGGAGR